MNAITEAKRKYLIEVFGEEAAKGILEDLEKKDKARESIGVAYKNFAEVSPAGNVVLAHASKTHPFWGTGAKEAPIMVELSRAALDEAARTAGIPSAVWDAMQRILPIDTCAEVLDAALSSSGQPGLYKAATRKRNFWGIEE